MALGTHASSLDSDRTAGVRRRPPRQVGMGVGGSVFTIAVVAAAQLTPLGGRLVAAGYRFLEIYTGVFALVGLSITVVGGLCATNRSVLLPRHRVVLQIAHRLTAALALGSLIVHIVLKVAEAHARTLDVLVPFLSPHGRWFMGFGTLAFALMVVLAWTGVSRARFAHSPQPRLWRGIHVAAYPAWLLAILHGLGAGRHAAGWVTVSYALCAGAVGLALLVRVGLATGRRGHAPRVRTGGQVRGVDVPEPRSAAVAPSVDPVTLARPAPPPPSWIDPGSSAPPVPPTDVSDEEFWALIKASASR